MIARNSVVEAMKLIVAMEHSPDAILCWEDAAPMVEALGGSVDVLRGCQHSASICIYIAALMVRNDRSTK